MSIYAEIQNHRKKQDDNWGEANDKLSLTELTLILCEEAGEAARAVNRYTHRGDTLRQVRIELIHTAAVAIQILERLDAGQWG